MSPTAAPRAITLTTTTPALVHALADMLRKEGVEVTFDAPQERRSLAATAGTVVVLHLLCRGLDVPFDAAVAKYRERFGKDATVDGDGPSPEK